MANYRHPCHYEYFEGLIFHIVKTIKLTWSGSSRKLNIGFSAFVQRGHCGARLIAWTVDLIRAGDRYWQGITGLSHLYLKWSFVCSCELSCTNTPKSLPCILSLGLFHSSSKEAGVFCLPDWFQHVDHQPCSTSVGIWCGLESPTSIFWPVNSEWLRAAFKCTMVLRDWWIIDSRNDHKNV